MKEYVFEGLNWFGEVVDRVTVVDGVTSAIISGELEPESRILYLTNNTNDKTASIIFNLDDKKYYIDDSKDGLDFGDAIYKVLEKLSIKKSNLLVDSYIQRTSKYIQTEKLLDTFSILNEFPDIYILGSYFDSLELFSIYVKSEEKYYIIYQHSDESCCRITYQDINDRQYLLKDSNVESGSDISEKVEFSRLEEILFTKIYLQNEQNAIENLENP